MNELYQLASKQSAWFFKESAPLAQAASMYRAYQKSDLLVNKITFFILLFNHTGFVILSDF